MELGKIRCTTIEELATVVAQLVREGVTFDANTATLVVTLTGGF